MKRSVRIYTICVHAEGNEECYRYIEDCIRDGYNIASSCYAGEGTVQYVLVKEE